MEISVSPSPGLQRLINSGPEAIRAAVAEGLNESGMDLVAAVQRKIQANKSVKTGNLYRSIRYVMPDQMTLRVGSAYGSTPLVYAAQVEFGGPIPKSGSGRLAWPVSPEYGGIVTTPSGVGGAHVAEAYAALGATGKFVRPSRSGRTRILFFTGPFGEKGYAPAFILADGVTQPGKPYLIQTVLDMADRVVAQIERAIINSGITGGA